MKELKTIVLQGCIECENVLTFQYYYFPIAIFALFKLRIQRSNKEKISVPKYVYANVRISL